MSEFLMSLKGTMTIISLIAGTCGIFFVRWIMALSKNNIDKADMIITSVTEIKEDIKGFKAETKTNFDKLEMQIERAREESQKGDIINKKEIDKVDEKIEKISVAFWKHLGAHTKDDYDGRNKTSTKNL